MSHSSVAEKLARLGYAARGAVYLIIGGLPLLAAVGGGGRATDSTGALQALPEAPLGRVLLAVVATVSFVLQLGGLHRLSSTLINSVANVKP